jgi:hypothetical protein
MAYLACQIKDSMKILQAGKKIGNGALIRFYDGQAMIAAAKIIRVSAVPGDKSIQNRNSGAFGCQRACQITAYEAQPAGYQDIAASKSISLHMLFSLCKFILYFRKAVKDTAKYTPG